VPSASATGIRKTLRDRARLLARPPESSQVEGAVLELLEFRLAQECYALETHYVSEVCPLKDLTLLPGTPAFLPGIVNIRGRITPVIDIKKFFDLPDIGLTDLHRIILVRGGDLEFGLLADAISGVRSIPAESLQASIPGFTGIREEYLKGVTSDRLVVLDFERILADPRIIVHEEVES